MKNNDDLDKLAYVALMRSSRGHKKILESFKGLVGKSNYPCDLESDMQIGLKFQKTFITF